MSPIVGNIMVQKRSVVSLGIVKEFLPIEDGDILQVSIEDGRIVLVPMRLVPADQVWFWSPDWQKGEKEADEDIKAGRIKSFDDMDELLEDLDK